jgi:putative ABC transport system permease protein
MLKNYFKIAFRNLWRNKLYTIINILGLVVGMTACTFILEYVSFKYSFDRFNTNYKDLYRVVNDRYQNGKLIQHGTITYSGVSKALKDDYPDEILNYSRVASNGINILKYENEKIRAEELAVDNSFLKMFSFRLIAGEQTNALKEPYTIVITRTLAKKIFKVQNSDFQRVIGKSVLINNQRQPYKITAICEDVPLNSHLSFDFLSSYVSIYTGEFAWREANYDFTQSDFWHYIQLKPDVNYKELQKKFTAFSQKHFQGNKVSGSDEKFYLQPLREAHLFSDFEYEIARTANGKIILGLLVIAIFTIVIAWINYVNLSTARATERAKEVGIRKVVGSVRYQLIFQFLLESLIINLIAFGIMVLVVLELQASFNNFINLSLSILDIFNQQLGLSFIIILISGFFLGVFVSGYYPAFVLSSFQPLTVLRGKFISSNQGVFLRKSLVVFQFTATIFLIIGTIVVFQQLQFMNQKDLGLKMNQILMVNAPTLAPRDESRVSRAETFKQKINQINGVKGLAFTDRDFGVDMARTFDVKRMGSEDDTKFTFRRFGVSPEFIDIYQIKILAGRNFRSSDYNIEFDKLHNLILNEKAVKQLGFKTPQEAIGKQIMVFGRPWDIIGVTGNFHQKSLHSPVEPLILNPTYSSNFPISIKVETNNLQNTIASIKATYASFFPDDIFNYYFLDQQFNRQYQDEKLLGNAIILFSGLIIVVACLGLFGLSLFIINQRTKEIGIRKVMGASVNQIVTLLSQDFLKLVLIAFLIAIPLAYYFMNQWLQSFAYRIEISWLVFFIAGVSALLIALLTVGYQAIKAGLANPIEALRSE